MHVPFRVRRGYALLGDLFKVDKIKREGEKKDVDQIQKKTPYIMTMTMTLSSETLA